MGRAIQPLAAVDPWNVFETPRDLFVGQPRETKLSGIRVGCQTIEPAVHQPDKLLPFFGARLLRVFRRHIATLNVIQNVLPEFDIHRLEFRKLREINSSRIFIRVVAT